MPARDTLSKLHISDLQIIACGFFLEGFPRNDTLWEALNRLDLKELIDLRDTMTLNSTQIDILWAMENERFFRKLTRKICSICRQFRQVIKIVRLVRRKRVDLIFLFHGNFFMTICLGTLRLIHGARVYFDLFCSAYSAERPETPRGFEIAEANILTLLSSRFADRLLCLTKEYASHYQYKYKIRPDRLSVVHDGVQSIWLDQPVYNNRATTRPKRVLYWGIFLAQHGLDMILDAAEELKGESVEFVFCGKGEGEYWAKEEVRRRNLDNVIFMGFIPTTEELIRVVDSADITFGHLRDMHDVQLSAALKQLQGMARSKPVIALWTKQKEDLYQTKDNPLPPVVQVEPQAKAITEAIKDLMNNPEKARQIGEIARSTVERLHSGEALASELKESLEKP